MTQHSAAMRRPLPGHTRGLCLIVLGACVAAAIAASSAGAYTYGEKELTQGKNGCCSDQLLGSRSTIKPQGTWTTSNAQCVEYYSNADDSVSSWIQTGMYRCFNGAAIDGTCFGGVHSYVEVGHPGIFPSCTDLGAEGSTTHKYTVDTTSGSTWSAYLDGTLVGPSIRMGAAKDISEVGEYSGGCADTVTASGGFAYTAPQRQRWTGSHGLPCRVQTNTQFADGQLQVHWQMVGHRLMRVGRMRQRYRLVILIGGVVAIACVGVGAVAASEVFSSPSHLLTKYSKQPLEKPRTQSGNRRPVFCQTLFLR